MRKIKVRFNSRDKKYKDPFGAIPSGTDLRLRLGVEKSAAISSATVVMKYDRHDRPAYYTMRRNCDLDENDFEYFETEFPIYSRGLYWYYFVIKNEEGLRFVGREWKTNTAAIQEEPSSWQQTVYRRDWKEPAWIEGGVYYHIFVDRFYHAGEYTEPNRKDQKVRKDWGGLPEYRPVGGRILNNDFFGGNLKGIRAKLPYLEDLGVTCLYLSPIFEAFSNHKYDTADYMKIDPMFGTTEDFEDLCRDAAERGIRVILDGVFAHTGSDSKYFNKYGEYGSVGAYGHPDSVYRSWYNFTGDGKYDSWWGIDTLPKVNKNNPDYREFICGEDGVVRHWLRKGASGWRLDVADELPVYFLEDIASAEKQENPDSLLIGEVWEDASNKIAYGERMNYFEGNKLDTVMDYPMRRGILDFVRDGDAQSLDHVVMQILENYPPFAIHKLMNFIGTHDSIRAITALAGKKIKISVESREQQASTHLSNSEYRIGVLRMKAASLLQMSLPGVPCIFYGDEAGLEGYADPFNRKCYPWGHEDRDLLEWYRKIIRIRRSHPVFRCGSYRTIRADGDVYAFVREDPDQQNVPMITIINRGSEPCPVPLDGMWYDLLGFDPHGSKIYCGRIVAEPMTAYWLEKTSEGRKKSNMGYQDNCRMWLESDCVDELTKSEIRALEGNEEELEDRFSEMMEFGTAGLRGIMRAGLNGMNVYTVRYATQGLADLINSCGEDQGSGVTIAYDCRNHSREFAAEAAGVLAANGIHVNLFEDLRPTPELSFALRETGSIAGINITASHNTKEYNGYKAYWSDGAQLPPEHAAEVSASMARIDIFKDVKRIDLAEAQRRGLLTMLGESMDEKYMEKVLEQSVGRKYVESAPDDFEIVYTPFHGTGYKLVPEVLKRLGIKHVIPVPEQMVVDGNFPTVKSPNPENVEGFERAIALAEEKDCELIIGTDPDGDRCGVAVKNGDHYETLTGNQIGVLLLDYLITMRRENGTLPANAAAVKSIVSTTMANKVCADNGVKCFEVLTGFKFIGEKIKEFLETGEYTFLFGFEESIGFLAGTYARDKDAVVASMLISEMACYYQSMGMNLAEAMQYLYKKYGYYKEKSIPVVFEGFDAKDRMNALMAHLREEAPTEVGLPVRRVRDYQSGIITDLKSGETEPTGLPKSNVLFYELEEDCTAVIRPSGTEPKIKLYVMVKGEDEKTASERFETVRSAGMKLIQNS